MLNQTEKYGVNVTATNREFLGMFKVFAETKDAKNVKFAVINVVNSKVLQDHLASLEQMATPTQEFVELSIKAKGLIEAENEEGLKQLEQENLELVEARKKQLQDVQEKLNEEATLELKLLNEKILPEDLSAEQLELISKLINS